MNKLDEKLEHINNNILPKLEEEDRSDITFLMVLISLMFDIVEKAPPDVKGYFSLHMLHVITRIDQFLSTKEAQNESALQA